MSLTNKQIVEKVNETFSDFSTEAFLHYCADDVTWNMLGDRVMTGKEAIRNFLDATPQQPPQFTITSLIGDEDMVMSNGEMIMKSKEGLEENYAFCDVYKMKNEKIQELTTYMVKTSAAKNS